MLCENCSKEIETTVCGHCGDTVSRFGSFCYLCGGELAADILPPDDTCETGFSDRLLCSDGSCIGVINEQGICKECGKPYTQEH